MTALELAYERLLASCHCPGDLNGNDVYVIAHTPTCPLGLAEREERGE